jgi:dTDP-4-dehydrorhamnose reductase
MMRLLVTGTTGQVARALAERGPAHGVGIALVGRPTLDLTRPSSVRPAIQASGGDVIVNAAAYTSVDQAETDPHIADAVNGAGAGFVAEAAAALGIPIIHLSTDYVFDGGSDNPYRETDAVCPLGAYGRSKLAGENAVLAAASDSAILRTAWVYSPFGRNFVTTMLRLAATREDVSVVGDQHGSPTCAQDVADGIIQVCRNLLAHPDNPTLRGVFHMTGAGAATWAEFAKAIFAFSERRGGPSARVRVITTKEYPTAARRPANSRLDNAKLMAIHGVQLPLWRTSLATCVGRILDDLPDEATS